MLDRAPYLLGPVGRLVDRICLLPVLVLLLLVSAGASGADLVFVADPWCPYNCEPDSDAPGLIVEVLDFAFTREGHTVSYQVLPWARAIEETRQGAFTGIIGAARPEAPDFIFPHSPIITAIDQFFVVADNPWTYTGQASLEAVCLGAIKGYAYGGFQTTYIQPHRDDPRRIFLATGEAPLSRLVNMLLAGRLDVIVEDRGVMGEFLASRDDAVPLRAAGEVGRDPIFVAFSPVWPGAEELAATLDRALRELTGSGELLTMGQRYGLDSVQLGAAP